MSVRESSGRLKIRSRRIWPLAAYDKAHLPLSTEAIAAGGADIDDLRLCNLSGVGTACPAGLAAALKDQITDLSPLVLKAALPLPGDLA